MQSLPQNLTILLTPTDWRRPLPSNHPSSSSPSPHLPFHATYARIVSLFLDDPSLLSPFSVHRFALMGKQLGKEVGEWFGPSTAAGAIKTLVNAYPPAGLQVYSVLDGTVYRSEVEAASRSGGETEAESWSKPVLVLIGLRLGIDGVNPIYHEGIKVCYIPLSQTNLTETDQTSNHRPSFDSLNPSE